MNSKRIMLLIIAGLVLSPIARAEVDVPLRNWTVPPYRVSDASGALSTMADLSPGIGFVAVTPCRIVDTRGGGVFTGAYGPPALVGNAAARSFDINSAAHCPGIPAGADAYSLNFTLIAAAGVFQNAFLTAWPTGGAQPVVSTLNFNAGQLEANAAIVPAGTNGSINVFVNAPGNLLIDINGYFTNDYPDNLSFEASSSTAGTAIHGQNTSTAPNAVAIRGVITSTAPGSSSVAVRGINNGLSTSGIGVWGSQGGSGYGVYGTSVDGNGVFGLSTGTTVRNYGVRGETSSLQLGSAGVKGVAVGVGEDATYLRAGVRGESNGGLGVLGLSRFLGVAGVLLSATPGAGSLATGSLGVNNGLDPDGGGPPWGVFADGNIGATGLKAFLEPHPTDPTRVIQFIALEGPEAGTYFRGRSRFQRGLASITVPETFRMVTDPEGLTVQITPIGEMASFAVVRMGLDRILVKSSRDVEFSYLVQGVRASFKDTQSIIRDGTFIPQSAGGRLPNSLSDRQKRTLVENGTYNPDGTINMETARRLGWDKVWEMRERPASEPGE